MLLHLFITASLFFPKHLSSFKEKKRLEKKIGKEKIFIPEFFHYFPDIFQAFPCLIPPFPEVPNTRMIKSCLSLNWIIFLTYFSFCTDRPQNFNLSQLACIFLGFFCGCVVLYLPVVTFKLYSS